MDLLIHAALSCCLLPGRAGARVRRQQVYSGSAATTGPIRFAGHRIAQ